MANTPGRFDRDFGYLMPFLDKVAQAASELPDPAAREELSRLVAEEKGRWARIQALLGGAKASAAPAPRVEPSVRRAPPRAPAPRDEDRRPPGLTVGSLRQR